MTKSNANSRVGSATRTRGEDSTLPAPAETTSPQAYQRAPTLMAGATAGGQGPVQVWAPHPWRHWMTYLGGLVGACMFATVQFANVFFFVGWRVVLPVIAVLVGLSAMIGFREFRKLCYLTTDDAGIGITTHSGARALQWSEIESMHVSRSDVFSFWRSFWAGQLFIDAFPVLILKAPEPLILNLSGFSGSEQDKIKALITEKAGLQKIAPTSGWRRVALPPQRNSSSSEGNDDSAGGSTGERTGDARDLTMRSREKSGWMQPHRH